MGSSSSKPESYETNKATAFVIPRDRRDDLPKGTPEGYHLRSADSLKHHLACAPRQNLEMNPKHYPHHFNDSRGEFPQRGQLSEYPAKQYRWGEDQNSVGKARATSSVKMAKATGPGHTRIITDADKTFVGVAYHPVGDLKRLDRAQELHLFGRGNDMHGLYRFNEQGHGKPIRVPTAERRW